MTNEHLADLLEEAARRLRNTQGSNPSLTENRTRVKRMTAAELAKKFGLHVETVRDYARRGILQGKNFKGSRGYYFDPEKAQKDLSLYFGNPAERELARRKRPHQTRD